MIDRLPRRCEVLVVGAGPAGATAGAACAARGLEVVLVDKAAFPRPKVCGCCLNARALSVLDRLDVTPTLRDAGAATLSRVALHAAGRHAAVPLPRGLAVSRARLDFELATAAAARGAAFFDRCRAAALRPIDEGWRATLCHGGLKRDVDASVVLLAEGLAGRLMEDSAVGGVRTRRDSRIGVGSVAAVEAHHAPPGVVTMVCGEGGYLGATVLEDGRLDLAAAIDPDAARRAGGPGPLAAELLRSARVDLGFDPASFAWRGTPRLTRRRLRVADERLFVLGDAAGYVEPFTGEGIAWATSAGLAVAPLAHHAVDGWRPEFADRWTATTRRLVRRRQRWCRAVSYVLRRPRLSGRVVGLLAATPGLSRPMVEAINRPVEPNPGGERVESCA